MIIYIVVYISVQNGSLGMQSAVTLLVQKSTESKVKLTLMLGWL